MPLRATCTAKQLGDFRDVVDEMMSIVRIVASQALITKVYGVPIVELGRRYVNSLLHLQHFSGRSLCMLHPRKIVLCLLSHH